MKIYQIFFPWFDNPNVPVPPHFEVSRSQSDTLHSVELPWTSDRTEAETLPEKKHAKQAHIHVPGGI
jgi:hypothetical protein